MKTAYFDCFAGISGNMILGAFLDAGVPLEKLERELKKLPLTDEYKLITNRVNKQGINACHFDVELLEHSQHNQLSPHNLLSFEQKQHHHHATIHTLEKQHSLCQQKQHNQLNQYNEQNHNQQVQQHYQQNRQQHHQHRGLREIRELLINSALAENVKNLALQIFNRLGQAEAKVHNCSPEEIHFHEVGAVDAIIDIVGAAYCLHYLGIEKVLASPLHVGKGLVHCAHGLMPVPAPATAELLKGIPFYSGNIEGELVTPTGAAIITTLTGVFAPLPLFKADTVAYGAGTWDLAIPNVLRLYLGEIAEETDIPPKKNSSTVIETNIDDMNPELYTYLFEKLYQSGATEVYLTPIHMKKNRPGTLLTVISELPNQKPLLEIIFNETTTLGIRMHEVEKYVLSRKYHHINTPYGSVRVKMGLAGKKVINIAPEYDDCKLLAEKTGIPLKKIYQTALQEASRLLF